MPSSSEALKGTITNSIGMKLVPISAGRFTMGSPASEQGSQEDEVLHKVELTKSFHMGSTEVTEHQWAMVMEEPFRTEMVEVRDPNTKRLIKKEEKQIKNSKLDSQLPITSISWSQAVEFCKRLSQLPEEKKEGRNYRLPTEAEWEYACRAETSTAYSFGDDAKKLDQYAWHSGNSDKVMPVAGKEPNAWGLYDMHGNVYEWCHDLYGNYPESFVSDPSGPIVPIMVHVIRGGSVHASNVRSGLREKLVSRGNLTGFRIVVGDAIPVHELDVQTNTIGQQLVKIPAGSFRMGSDKGERAERPVHEVAISKPFFIATTEVTQGQWESVMGTSPWKGRQYWKAGENYAASYISWDDAVEFCRRLTSLPEVQNAGRIYRLPTEAEWEYACRAGTTTEYIFGDQWKPLDYFGWYSGSRAELAGVEIVGQKQPNFWGLHDMHGNVYEWCSDWLGAYQNNSALDPVGPPTGEQHVYRGGSWSNNASRSRSAFRNEDFWGRNEWAIGLRVVCDASTE